MEAEFTNKSFSENLTFSEAATSFFKGYTPDSTREIFWKIFQCWALKDCKIKAEISDEEVALFFDQLIDLVAAAYTVHQANRVSDHPPEGLTHDS